MTVAQERQEAARQRLQLIWNDSRWPMFEAFAADHAGGTTVGVLARNRHYMLSKLTLLDLANIPDAHNLFRYGATWSRVADDIRVPPWQWANHATRKVWDQYRNAMASHYHATIYPGYTAVLYAQPNLVGISLDEVRQYYNVYGGRAAVYEPHLHLPLHGTDMVDASLVAGSTTTADLTVTSGHSPYTYHPGPDAPSWVSMMDNRLQFVVPSNEPNGVGSFSIIVRDSVGEELLIPVTFTVGAAGPLALADQTYDATVGVTNELTLNAIGGLRPYTYTLVTTVFSWMSLSGDVLSITPPAGIGLSIPITIQATDARHTVVNSTITIRIVRD